MSFPPIPNLAALEMHISRTTTPLFYLLLESLGLTVLDLDHISSHLSLCIGIVTTLRSIPFRCQHGELALPLDLCAKHNLIQETVFRSGSDAPGLKDVALDVATQGNDHLHTARQYIEDMRSKNKNLLEIAFCIFLPAVSPLARTNDRSLRGNISSGLKRPTLIPFSAPNTIGSYHIGCGMHNIKRNYSLYSNINPR